MEKSPETTIPENVSTLLPTFRTVNTAIGRDRPQAVLPRSIGTIEPSVRFAPLNSTTISGPGGATTSPQIGKWNALSSVSFVDKEISPLLTPGSRVSSCTTNTSDAPGARLVGNPFAMEKPGGTASGPSDS